MKQQNDTTKVNRNGISECAKKGGDSRADYALLSQTQSYLKYMGAFSPILIWMMAEICKTIRQPLDDLLQSLIY